MSDAVKVALIGLIGSGFGSLIGVLVSSKLTQYRIEQLEKKVEKHNNLVERMYALERKVESDEKITEFEFKELKEDIKQLHKFHEE